MRIPSDLDCTLFDLSLLTPEEESKKGLDRQTDRQIVKDRDIQAEDSEEPSWHIYY